MKRERPRPSAERVNPFAFGDELVARVLRNVLAAMIALGLLLAIITAAAGNVRTLTIAGINLAIAAVLLALVRRGQVRVAAAAMTFTLLGTAVYAMATAKGIHDTSVLLLPLVFVLASVLLDSRWLLAVAGVTELAVVVVGLLGVGEVAIAGGSVVTHYTDIAEVAVLLGMCTAAVYVLMDAIGRALREARRSQRDTRAVLDATNEAIWIHDARSGEVVDVNASTLDMYGATREEIVSAPGRFSSNEPPYDPPHAIEHIQRALTEGPQTIEWRARKGDGTLFWAEITLRHADIGDRSVVLAVVRDVSKRRQLEERLREAEKLEAVGRIAGGVAHDFNNQLMGIMGYAELLQQEVADPDLRESIDAIATAADHAANLTKQMLAFARKGRRGSSPVDLHRLVEEVRGLTARSVDKRIEIRCQLEARGNITIGDASALQSAILNLALNARDAMPHGGTLTFRSYDREIESAGSESSSRLAPGNYCCLEVEDTGSGMPPEVTRRIFEPFYTTKRSGTGMGLAALQGTVTVHHGAVEVETEPGRGTIFRLLLPVAAVEGPESEAPKESRAGGSASKKGRVLVVDDERVVSDVAKRSLTRGGYDVEICNDPTEAADRYTADPFDLVLLDVVMPKMDGPAVLAELLRRDRDVVVLMMTGHAGEEVLERLRAFEDVELIAKPFGAAKLVTAVDARLAARGRRRHVASSTKSPG